jgi:FeS assembly SUF system protein
MADIESLKERVIGVLKQIYDPEIPLNIYELGLIYNLQIEEREEGVVCSIKMTMTAPGCPVADMLLMQVQSIAQIVEGIERVEVTLVFDPPWNEERISYEGRLQLGLL